MTPFLHDQLQAPFLYILPIFPELVFTVFRFCAIIQMYTNTGHSVGIVRLSSRGGSSKTLSAVMRGRPEGFSLRSNRSRPSW